MIYIFNRLLENKIGSVNESSHRDDSLETIQIGIFHLFNHILPLYGVLDEMPAMRPYSLLEWPYGDLIENRV